MKVLFDLLHPANSLKFRFVIEELKRQGHEVIVTARDKDVTCQLLDAWNIPYIKLSTMGKGKVNLLTELISRNIRLIRVCLKEKPHVMVGYNGISIAQVGWLLRIPSVYVTENEDAKLLTILGTPFATKILTEKSFMKDYEKKHRFIEGFFEQAYLTDWTPDAGVLEENDLLDYSQGPMRDNAPKIKPYSFVRFVAMKATHDFGEKGLSFDDKIKIVELLEKKGRVIVNIEGEYPPEFEKYKMKSSPEKVHSLIYFAQLYIGDSQAMASEAGILGTPAIRCNSLVDTAHAEGKFWALHELKRVWSTAKPQKAMRLIDELYGKKKPILINRQTIPSMVKEILNTNED